MPPRNEQQPLAEKIRPRSLDEFIGQEHLVAPGKPLHAAINRQIVPSMIFWGPPGVGKTTLARIVAAQTQRPFFALSAVSAGKADLQKIVGGVTPPRQRGLFDAPPPEQAVLFLDEIHRFNKAQQDYLLPFVEDGSLILIGATTENPSFEVISALLSRVQVFVLKSLNTEHIERIVRRGLDVLGATMDEAAVRFLAEYANGDARAALNLLDNAVRLYGDSAAQITIEQLKETLQSKQLRYDKGGEEHYNTISAYIKSMRASQIDAALYYLARMIDAGEDPKFIARRMVIFASEDIGMADPQALTLANAVFRAVETVGLPEAQINLAHGTVYMAAAPKDKSAYLAYFDALKDVQQHGNLPIPLQIRNAPTSLMRDLGYGQGYTPYTEENLLPEALSERRYYRRDE